MEPYPADTFAGVRIENHTSNYLELVNLIYFAALMSDYRAMFLILTRP